MRKLLGVGLFACAVMGCTGPVGSVATTLSNPDDGPQCNYTTAKDPKTVVLDQATLCAAENDGSLALRPKIEHSPGLHATDAPTQGRGNTDPGFASDRCQAICGDAAFTHCLIEGEYVAFNAEAQTAGCGWANTKPNATLTCYKIETYRATCSPSVG